MPLLNRQRFPIVVIGVKNTGLSCQNTLLGQCEVADVFRIHSLALRARICVLPPDARFGRSAPNAAATQFPSIVIVEFGNDLPGFCRGIGKVE